MNNALLSFVEWFFLNMNTITLVFIVSVFSISCATKKYKNQKMDLEKHIMNAMTSATIPTGAALIFCAFNQDFIKSLEGLGVNLCIAGLVVLYTSIKSSWKGVFS